MGLNNLLEDKLKENLRFSYLPDENLILQNLATLREGWKVSTNEVFLTNKRLIIQINVKNLIFQKVAGGIAGGVGGYLGGGIFGSFGGRNTWLQDRALKKAQNKIINIQDIVEIKASRYKLFGIIPTPSVGILITDNFGKSKMLLFSHRDEWLAKLLEVKASTAGLPTNGWRSIRNERLESLDRRI